MGGLSIWHWVVVGVILLLLFGKGRFSEMMGDVAKGIKSFKKGMTEDEEAAHRAVTPPAAPRQIDAQRSAETAAPHADPVDPLAKPTDRAGTDGRSL